MEKAVASDLSGDLKRLSVSLITVSPRSEFTGIAS